MKQFTVTQAEAGQRLDKFLGKYLNKAPKSFLYKMMRKKNITLNGKKAAGSEKLVSGDEIKLFFSDETIEKFSELQLPKAQGKLSVIYEDEHILLVNKPEGILSQKAEADDISMVEEAQRYLLNNGAVTGGIPPNLPPVGGKPAGPEHERHPGCGKRPGGGPGAEPPFQGAVLT